MKKVLIAVATYRNIASKTVNCIFSAMTFKSEYQWGFAVSDTANVPISRNQLVDMFLDSQCDYLVFIDQDMIFEPWQLTELVKTLENNPSAGIASGFYLKRDGSFVPLCVWTRDNDKRKLIPYTDNIDKIVKNRGKIVQADLVPTGFFAVRREVFDVLQKPYFELGFDGDESWSSDSEFCYKVAQAGFNVLCNLGLEIGHIGDFTWTPEMFYKQADNIKNQHVLSNAKEFALSNFDINSQQYWDYVWGAERKMGMVRIYKNLYDAILERIPRIKKIADFGCGPGVFLTRAVKERAASSFSKGFDISNVAVDNIKGSGNCNARLWDATQDSLIQSGLDTEVGYFDIAVSTELLEHLEDPTNLLNAMFNSLKDGGKVFISCPNNCLSPDEEPEHKKVYTAESLTSLMEPYFDNIEVIEIDHYLLGMGNKRKGVGIGVTNN